MNIRRSVFENGVRYIEIPMKDTHAITCMVLVEAGSNYERKEINGLSHFLEHMCFKGTEKRKNALIISSELDAIGAQYNAFTSNEYTGYYAKAHARHASKIIDVVSDIYVSQLFDPAEIEKEKGVIIEEINMYEDMPQYQVWSVLKKALYGDQPAGWDILGPKEVIQSLTREHFISYVQEKYIGKSTCVVVAGAIPEDDSIKHLIEKAFIGLSQDEKKDKEPVREVQHEPVVAIKKRDTDQSHLILALRTFNEYDEKNYPLKVLNAVLGKGMSSRLFNKLRDQMGVCYYVRSEVDTYSDHGYVAISTGVDTRRLEEVVTVLTAELRALTLPISSEEIEKAKEYLIGQMYLNLETSDTYADHYGFQEIYHKPLRSPEEIEQKIRSVTAEDLQRVAKEIVKKEHITLALVSPYEDEQKLKDILLMI